MLTGRRPYTHLNDPTGTIPDNMPVFILLASDALAVDFVREWARRVRDLGGTADTVGSALDQADAMAIWGDKHGVKVPGV